MAFQRSVAVAFIARSSFSVTIPSRCCLRRTPTRLLLDLRTPEISPPRRGWPCRPFGCAIGSWRKQRVPVLGLGHTVSGHGSLLPSRRRRTHIAGPTPRGVCRPSSRRALARAHPPCTLKGTYLDDIRDPSWLHVKRKINPTAFNAAGPSPSSRGERFLRRCPPLLRDAKARERASPSRGAFGRSKFLCPRSSLQFPRCLHAVNNPVDNSC